MVTDYLQTNLIIKKESLLERGKTMCYGNWKCNVSPKG